MDHDLYRIYEPWELGEDGDPLDWRKCRTCDGTGVKNADPDLSAAEPCPACDGHGSLEAAVMAYLAKQARGGRTYDHEADCFTKEVGGGPCTCEPTLRPLRCEDCKHPMSEGTWVLAFTADSPGPVEVPLLRAAGITDDRDPWRVHYSLCDERCEHDGPYVVTYRSGTKATISTPGCATASSALVDTGIVERVEASWRIVEVRRLGHPHDLRPDHLALLCTRCWADRLRERAA